MHIPVLFIGPYKRSGALKSLEHILLDILSKVRKVSEAKRLSLLPKIVHSVLNLRSAGNHDGIAHLHLPIGILGVGVVELDLLRLDRTVHVRIGT